MSIVIEDLIARFRHALSAAHLSELERDMRKSAVANLIQKHGVANARSLPLTAVGEALEILMDWEKADRPAMMQHAFKHGETGPIRSVLRDEFVPGVHGMFKFDALVCDDTRIALSFANDPDDLTLGAHFVNAADLRKAIENFTDVADFLDGLPV